MEFVIITGMSGAGKSQALNALEDMGYYAMDNLPPSLLTNFAELSYNSKRDIKKVAAVVDIRGGVFFDDLFSAIEALHNKGFKTRIIFLDANDNILIKRYKELRRPHPLSPQGTILEGIKNERIYLEKVKREADYVIDTSKYNIGKLRERIDSIFLEDEEDRKINISVVSFGFKHGILLDGDLIFDVRFIPNPYYIEELRELTGRDKPVADYVFQHEESNVFMDKLVDMVDYLIPYYVVEGKPQLIIGIGCTGGRHRSIAIAEKLGEILRRKGHKALVEHRDTKFS